MLKPISFSHYANPSATLKQLSVDPNSTDSGGATPLMYAAQAEAFHTRSDGSTGPPIGFSHTKVRVWIHGAAFRAHSATFAHTRDHEREHGRGGMREGAIVCDAGDDHKISF
jgi:hypothetical protein